MACQTLRSNSLPSGRQRQFEVAQAAEEIAVELGLGGGQDRRLLLDLGRRPGDGDDGAGALVDGERADAATSRPMAADSVWIAQAWASALSRPWGSRMGSEQVMPLQT